MPREVKWAISLAVGLGLVWVGWKVYFVLIALHVLICGLLIVVVLLQSGEAADLAGAFGGAGSQTAFGARSGATFLTRATAVLGALFVLGSLGLGMMKKNGAGGSVMSGVAAPATSKSAVPALPTTSAPPPIPVAAPSTSGTGGGSAPAAGGSQSKTPLAPTTKKGGGR